MTAPAISAIHRSTAAPSRADKDGIRLADLGSSEVTLKQATFENNTQSDIHLGDGQTINIKKTFTGTATILTDDPSRGRHITLENEDLSYQNKLKLFSMNSGYIIGYKRDAMMAWNTAIWQMPTATSSTL